MAVSQLSFFISANSDGFPHNIIFALYTPQTQILKREAARSRGGGGPDRTRPTPKDLNDGISTIYMISTASRVGVTKADLHRLSIQQPDAIRFTRSGLSQSSLSSDWEFLAKCVDFSIVKSCPKIISMQMASSNPYDVYSWFHCRGFSPEQISEPTFRVCVVTE